MASDRSSAALALLVALVACGGAEEPAPASPPPAEETEAPAEAPADEPEVATPSEGAEPSAAVDPAAPVHPCEENVDCGWDHSCAPTRCVAAEHADSPDRACFATAPPPGECLCVRGRCTLRRDEDTEAH